MGGDAGSGIIKIGLVRKSVGLGTIELGYPDDLGEIRNLPDSFAEGYGRVAEVPPRAR